jgi:3-hydroxyacyl-[acyl-carrier-protein] dehydratase
MLVNFYKIMDPEVSCKEASRLAQNTISWEFRIELNPQHPVYEGHFPGNPVVPGVCQVQIIKELLTLSLGKEVALVQSGNIKFLSMISPDHTPVLNVRMEMKEPSLTGCEINAVISSGENIFIKFKGSFLLS